MLNGLTLITILAVVLASSCSGPYCDTIPQTFVGPADLADGTWVFAIDRPTLRGPCEQVDLQALSDGNLRGVMGTVPGALVHLDLEGDHMEGAIGGDALHAEGWVPSGFLGERGQGLVLDAVINDPQDIAGDLLLRVELDNGMVCEIEGTFSAWLDPESDGEGRLCDIPVPLDPRAPVEAPAQEDVSWCD